MKKVYLLFSLIITVIGYGQTFTPSAPVQFATGTQPNWNQAIEKDAVDSCGAYFNNYVGLTKTSSIFFEELRTGDGSDFSPYSGRGQRFHAFQPIEVSGIQFYSFENNPVADSMAVITVLYDYDADNDSVGVELARDTVIVPHTAFDPLLPSIAVNSFFDEPVTVTDDYIVALYTNTNDSLKIICNSAAAGDGEGEGVSFAYYENPVAPSFTGWYSTLPTFGPAYDIDYLINPLVKYDLHNSFVIEDDSICPTIVDGACVDYEQVPNFADPHYNSSSEDPLQHIVWNWGDGFENTALAELCHTYGASGTNDITLSDTIFRHDFVDNNCAVEVTQSIVVLDLVTAGATFTAAGTSVVFDGTAIGADSVFWDFADGSAGSTEIDTDHTYDALGTYEVWFYAYGPCNTDSTSVIIVIDDVSVTNNSANYSVFPNPANETLQITGLNTITSVEILTMLGEIVFETTPNSSVLELVTTDFAPGTYVVRISDETGISTKKLIIKH